MIGNDTPHNRQSQSRSRLLPRKVWHKQLILVFRRDADPGVAHGDLDADPSHMIKNADIALYRAKDKGRARWELFDNAMRASAVDRLGIENALNVWSGEKCKIDLTFNFYTAYLLGFWSINDAAIDLLRNTLIETAITCLHVKNRNLSAFGRNYC